ncbi:maleylpyruvate isomerase [Tsukamurella pulmonis]|uniref:Maleylpyruvate isomerase n=1 Tax=Tsukamurella pulmonis TaxID=47312 RepID=A0A1H1GF08_9ACTN|nr:maleylpyruvate isomerase family mycothiol-dependent enzyme [Tsukamurella pulmonis]KXO88475.1 maleylpyruvate isomerase [Tsukamurella pulmonis]SDR11689.1 maleylpyruvate isomerase [Tsukamurella pulmonis]SUP17382.1 mycothiol-dependent maleylpyruvate isomerase [Tsukamurella pulmonis]
MTGFRERELADQLLIARRGTAHFARHLGGLTDAELDEPSALPGWSRRHLLAHVGYNAIALCRLMDWAVTGTRTPMYESAEQRAREIAEGATVNAGALRNLFDHSVARLDEKWRNAPPAAWSATVQTAQGRLVPAAETVWMRTREVWIHSVDLGTDARFADFPAEVCTTLIDDVVGVWRQRGDGAGLVLSSPGRDPVPVTGGEPARTVAGPVAAVARWATGRGGVGLDDPSGAPHAPQWL